MLESAQRNGPRGPGGDGVVGAFEITGPIRLAEAGPTAAVGEVEAVHPSRTAHRAHRAAARTGE
jgi:hypothetical protein